MLWVGGSIILHGIEHFGFHGIGDAIKSAAQVASQLPTVGDIAAWLTTATLDGLFGLALGLLLMPIVHAIINPAIEMVKGGQEA